MPAYAGIQILDSGFRRNDDGSVGVLNPIENKKGETKFCFAFFRARIFYDTPKLFQA